MMARSGDVAEPIVAARKHLACCTPQRTESLMQCATRCRRLATVLVLFASFVLFVISGPSAAQRGAEPDEADYAAKKRRALHDARGIVNAIKLATLKRGRRPAALGEIATFFDGDRVPRDPWGNDFVYRALDKRAFEVASLGADGKPGGTGAARDLVVDRRMRHRPDAVWPADTPRPANPAKAANPAGTIPDAILAERRQRVIGGLSLERPMGFRTADKFHGFIHHDTRVTLVGHRWTAPFLDVLNALVKSTSTGVKRTVLSVERRLCGTDSAALIHTRRESPEHDRHAWMLIVGDANGTLGVLGSCPTKTREAHRDLILKTLDTVRCYDGLTFDPFYALGFRVRHPAFKHATRIGHEVFLSGDDGTPTLTVHRAFAPAPIDAPERLAAQLLTEANARHTAIRVHGVKAIESTATVPDANGTSATIYQLLVPTEGRTYFTLSARVTAASKADGGDPIAALRACARSFRAAGPVDSATRTCRAIAQNEFSLAIPAAGLYRLKHRTLPSSAEQLKDVADGIFERDPWGHPYRLRALDAKRLEVASLGADGKPGGDGADEDVIAVFRVTGD